MIGRIKGQLIEKSSCLLVIEVYGVGYEIFTPESTISLLPKIGEEITLYTHFIAREDNHQLYGFTTKFNRRLFQELIKIGGVGSKMALMILSNMNGDTLIQCVNSRNYSLLCNVPGIGKKIAERITIELKDKIDKILSDMDITLNDFLKSGNQRHYSPYIPEVIKDATEVLISLGYKKKDAEYMIRRIESKEHTLEEIVKMALKTGLKR